MLAEKLRAATAAVAVDPNAWDLANAVYQGSPINNFYVGIQETTPTGLFFKPDGLKVYVIGTAGDDVNEYNLSTAWDVSTASYSQSFFVGTEETTPTGLFFKPDGLKMYVIGSIGDDVNEYNLSTAWNISTASYSQNFSVAAQETNPQGIFFKPDGLKMYFVGATGDNVYEYNLSTAWDVSTTSYSQSFFVGTEETTPTGLFFKPDGLKMYIIGSSGDDVNEYNLSTAWDVSTASYSQSFFVGSQASNPQGIFFKPDGLKMYVIGSTSDTIWSYDLSTAWDVSTASYAAPITNYFYVGTEETTPTGLFFKPDGLKMYVIGSTYKNVHEYNLSTAWDVSTTSYSQSFSVIGQAFTPTDVFFKPDGLKMYVIGSSSDAIWSYDLSTAWDVSTASVYPSTGRSVSAQDGNPQGIFFKPDGLKMYFVGATNDYVYEYNLSTAWDVHTAIYSQFFSVRSEEANPSGLFFKPNGLKMYVIGTTGSDVNEYNLSTAWDVSTASYSQNFLVKAQASTPTGLFFKPDGLKMYVIGSTNNAIFSYDFV